MRWAWASAVLAGALVGLAQPVRADCPNACNLTVTATPTIDPAIACLTVVPSAESCDCGVVLVVTNNCPDAVNATDFQFTSCGAMAAGATNYKCPGLQPGEQGVDVLAIPASSGIGAKTWTLHVQEGGTTSAITIDAHVMSFVSGCSCALSQPDAAHRCALSLVTVGGLAAVILGARRRRRRARSRQRHA
jgi:hypothetical protein